MRKERMVIFVLVGSLVLLLSNAAPAQLAKIEIIFAMGLTSSFDADGGLGGDGLQTLVSTNGAYVYTDDIYAPPISFAASDILCTFEQTTDTSSGGIASAWFDSGAWRIKLFSSGNLVLDMSGGVDWYDELETAANTVDGRGIVSIGSVYLAGELAGHQWASTNGKSGLISSIVNAQPQPLTSYQTDWSSNNVMMLLYADSSAIPEPATIMVLGLGAVGLLGRKRRQ